MRIKDLNLVENFCMLLGITGASLAIVGGGLALGGGVGIGITSVAKHLEVRQPLLNRMVINGFIFVGSGLMVSRCAAALARTVGESLDEENIQELIEEANEYIRPENRRRTYKQWEEYEELKKSCRGCRFYRGGGMCSHYVEIITDCQKNTKLNLCQGCKFYSEYTLVKCAVHPELPQDCSDYESSAEV